jgi:hypothetical protein
MSKIEVDAIDKQSGSTLTLGGSGTAVTLACGATQTGFGRTGTVDWNTTPKTATFSAVSGDGFFCNTTGGAFTCNLPAGSAGAIVSLADYAGTWQTNALTVSPNGTEKIGSVNADVVLNTEGQSVTLVYVDGTQGWINTMDSTSNVRANAFVAATGGTITTSGNDKIHTFTGPGTFTVSGIAACAANNVVSYMVVAGGGAGGGSGQCNTAGGGGGAGGFREAKSPATPYTASPLDGYPSAPNRITVTATAFPITVGGGGVGNQGYGSMTSGNQGNNSIFSSITSAGGGGGATAVGSVGNPPTGGGPGGAGATTSINATPTAFAGGGAGGNGSSSGGTGGGGAGANGGPNSIGTAGTANTGGGGGGSQTGTSGPNGTGGNGGSGIVIIRYKFQ